MLEKIIENEKVYQIIIGFLNESYKSKEAIDISTITYHLNIELHEKFIQYYTSEDIINIIEQIKLSERDIILEKNLIRVYDKY